MLTDGFPPSFLKEKTKTNKQTNKKQLPNPQKAEKKKLYNSIKPVFLH